LTNNAKSASTFTYKTPRSHVQSAQNNQIIQVCSFAQCTSNTPMANQCHISTESFGANIHLVSMNPISIMHLFVHIRPRRGNEARASRDQAWVGIFQLGLRASLV
jgi:hypothetical protein